VLSPGVVVVVGWLYRRNGAIEVLVVKGLASLMHALLGHQGGGIECWNELGELQEHVLHLAFKLCLMCLLFSKPSGELFHLLLEVVVICV